MIAGSCKSAGGTIDVVYRVDTDLIAVFIAAVGRFGADIRTEIDRNPDLFYRGWRRFRFRLLFLATAQHDSHGSNDKKNLSHDYVVIDLSDKCNLLSGLFQVHIGSFAATA